MKTKVFLLLLTSLLIAGNSFGQKNDKKIVIIGTVVDAQQNPVTGAMVIVDNLNTKISTDKNGYYRVKVRADADTIAIVSLNKGLRLEPINGRTTIDFTLGESRGDNLKSISDSNKDDVIDVGYGNLKERNMITNVNTINDVDGKYDSFTNMYEVIKGLPGVFVRGKSIQIQGPSSINFSSEPLLLLDGLPTESLDGINPKDVQSVSVLKGSAAAIYGSRGASGVIVITLKK